MNFDVPIHVILENEFQITPPLSAIDGYSYNGNMALIYGRASKSAVAQQMDTTITTINDEGPNVREFSPRPYVMFFDKSLTFSQICDERKVNEPITCANLAYHANIIIAGHKSGSFSIINADTQELTLKVESKEQIPITFITYTADDLAILTVDKENRLVFYDKIDSIFAPKPNLLYQFPIQVRKVYMPSVKTPNPFIIYSTKKSVGIFYVMKPNSIEEQTTEISSSNEKVNFIAKNTLNGSVIVVVWFGSTCQIFSIEQNSATVTPYFEQKFGQNIRECSIIKNFAVNVFFTDGSVEDIINYKKKKSDVEHYESTEIKKCLKKISGVIVHDELSYIITPIKMHKIQYISWNERIIGISRKGDFTKCFEMANQIYSGTVEHLFGLSNDPSTRCIELQKVMKDVLFDSLCTLETSNSLSQAFKIAIHIGMSNFVVETAYKYFKEDDNLKLYFEAIEHIPSISKYLTMNIFRDFINYKKEQGSLLKYEDTFVKINIPPQYADEFIEISIQNGLYKVLINIWTKIYHDFLSPCRYLFFNQQTDLFIQFVYDMFLTDKYNASRSNKESVLFWITTEALGVCPRLIVLLTPKNPSFVPELLIEQLIQYVPAKLNGVELSMETFCNLILQTVIADDENKEICDQCINAISHEIVSNQVKILTLDNMKKLFNWAFSSKNASITVRETIVLMLNNQFPEYVKFENIIDYCEAAGFSTIVNIIYGPKKEYGRIIHAMALSEERRKMVFEYINNPNMNNLNLLQGFEEEEVDESSSVSSISSASYKGKTFNTIKQSMKEISLLFQNLEENRNKITNLINSTSDNEEKNKDDEEDTLKNKFKGGNSNIMINIEKLKKFSEMSKMKQEEEKGKEIDEEISESVSISESESESEDSESSSTSSSTSSSKVINEQILDEPPEIICEEQHEEEKEEEPLKLCNDEMYSAVIENFSLLLLINADKAAELSAKYFPDEHSAFLKKDIDSFVKFLYLRALNKSEYGQSIMNKDDEFELLALTCRYSPPDVLPMIKTTQTIPLEDALRICKQYRVIDACMHIHTLRGDIQAAVNLVAEEIEAVLVDAIQKGGSIYAPSVDLVKEAPELKKAYETVLVTFDLLSKAPKVGQLLDKMWKDAFLAFQLPLYLVCGHDISPDTKIAITLFFAFFVVEALQRTSPENIFNVLKSDFCSIDQQQYRNVLSAVFKYLDYNQMLSNTVIELLLEDCIQLYQKSNLTKTRAAFAYKPECVICNTPITGAGGIGALIFECGHVYHNNQRCGQGSKKCKLCRNELVGIKQNDIPQQESKNSQSMKLRKLLRVEYGLRRHYGKFQDVSESGSNIFFMSDFPVVPKQLLKLTLPESDELPEERLVFLEL